MADASGGEQQVEQRWRADGAKTVWVQPVPAKAEVVVLLPERPHWRGDARWRLVLSSDQETIERWRDSDSRGAVVFPVEGAWVISVFYAADGEEYPLESFAAYYPELERLSA